jgi:hypothetical protein
MTDDSKIKNGTAAHESAAPKKLIVPIQGRVIASGNSHPKKIRTAAEIATSNAMVNATPINKTRKKRLSRNCKTDFRKSASNAAKLRWLLLGQVCA